VYQTLLVVPVAVPKPCLSAGVQSAAAPGAPGAVLVGAGEAAGALTAAVASAIATIVTNADRRIPTTAAG
jgi:hypothetical protein